MSDSANPEPNAIERDDPSSSPESLSEKDTSNEKGAISSTDSESHGDDPQPHLHAKTFLAVFAVCLIYFAQDFALVGAGAV